MKVLLDMVKQQKKGVCSGVYAVCTSNPLVIEAAMQHVLLHNETLLLEATSNQVNQDGGYTGMTPKDFRKMVLAMANRVGLNEHRIILGGDHLGPNCWQHLDAEEAMQKSEILIDQYVRAGFGKIHLDCSMSCSDDPIPLGDHDVAKRAARLCLVAEKAWKDSGSEAPVYVIGTEVPVPGGTQDDSEELELTSVEDANTTIAIHQKTFAEAGLSYVWPRIIGLVVQPGVEFGLHKIDAFVPEKAHDLSEMISHHENMVFEAHSTDYQTQQHLTDLVSAHFGILKVGPWLTFAFREACFALECIEQEWIAANDWSNLKNTLLTAMHTNDSYWKKYYSQDSRQQELDCKYSLSDRIRYYWPDKNVDKALSQLIENLEQNPPPLTLISQYMPEQHNALIAGEIDNSIKGFIFHKISLVLKQYSAACNPQPVN
ncbi:MULTISPECIES: D-tagatose-bisphosphate aldolase, class II, non-catalytic subunit [Aliiglaciecola]|uniref:D-tagatose-bisphosphate aldolase, class II, non-catalytic subunit n=1 Tax=Aliiglaciecola TaxID=1406885 RepID=UPI002090C1BC|nr:MULTISPECIES: D-tagatose-bisphosphate aldolase, class II, non-catalytic subunit [Aliiglaciecola]MDO6712930.1 D-tagatose-bisphosphate aldolase, class II, non-catalytic subunit [Aliiglaciecola sp. 2_MG-2023]MDO6753969.1 D-tagatose-bisphosphate aldolase, class II, non-catalytic subunit [Aliiglaciecola sp. 1_MG-2023]